MYIIHRDSKAGGGYVAPAGYKHSYVFNVLLARQYPTREAAKADLCVGNETVEPAYQQPTA